MQHGRLALLHTASGQPSTEATESATGAQPTYSVGTVPVAEEPNPNGQCKKCVDGPCIAACCAIRCQLSGVSREASDELAAEMEVNQDTFDKNIEILTLS